MKSETQILSDEPVNDFEDLYRRYRQLVRAVIFRVAGAGELDDLVQEAFVKIWKGLPRFFQKSRLKTWVYRVSVNTALDFLRKRRETPVDYIVEKADKAPAVDKKLADRQQVENLLQQLTPEHRAVLVLHYYEDMDTAEISRVTGTARNTVKSRLVYARKKQLSC